MLLPFRDCPGLLPEYFAMTRKIRYSMRSSQSFVKALPIPQGAG
jgi:hypothetical protein